MSNLNLIKRLFEQTKPTQMVEYTHHVVKKMNQMELRSSQTNKSVLPHIL
jgi:hypothetical protein